MSSSCFCRLYYITPAIFASVDHHGTQFRRPVICLKTRDSSSCNASIVRSARELSHHLEGNKSLPASRDTSMSSASAAALSVFNVDSLSTSLDGVVTGREAMIYSICLTFLMRSETIASRFSVVQGTVSFHFPDRQRLWVNNLK